MGVDAGTRCKAHCKRFMAWRRRMPPGRSRLGKRRPLNLRDDYEIRPTAFNAGGVKCAL